MIDRKDIPGALLPFLNGEYMNRDNVRILFAKWGLVVTFRVSGPNTYRIETCERI